MPKTSLAFVEFYVYHCDTIFNISLSLAQTTLYCWMQLKVVPNITSIKSFKSFLINSVSLKCVLQLTEANQLAILLANYNCVFG